MEHPLGTSRSYATVEDSSEVAAAAADAAVSRQHAPGMGKVTVPSKQSISS